MRIVPMHILREWLADVSYKPGWAFEVYEGTWEGPHLVITAAVPDAHHEGETTTLDVHSMLPPIMNRDQFYHWLLWRLARIEVHEAREFFQIAEHLNATATAYHPWSDPHAEHAGRDR